MVEMSQGGDTQTIKQHFGKATDSQSYKNPSLSKHLPPTASCVHKCHQTDKIKKEISCHVVSTHLGQCFLKVEFVRTEISESHSQLVRDAFAMADDLACNPKVSVFDELWWEWKENQGSYKLDL